MPKTKTKKTIGIIRGGNTENYDYSIREGGEIISHIFENLSDKWKPIDILIDKEGVWHAFGVPIQPADLAHKVELVWNTAHHGVANTLQSFSIPTINISSFSSLLKQNHDTLREHLDELGLKMPRKILLPVYQSDLDGPLNKYVAKKAREVLGKFSAPWIIKSYTPDQTMGIHVAKTFPELISAIEDGINHEDSILIEEFIDGKETSLHSVGGFRGEDVYVFPPGNFSSTDKNLLLQTAKNLHKHLGAEHYLCTNIVLHPKRGVFVTGVSFSPDLKKDSALHKISESVGAKVHHIVEHILEKTLS